ncbi:hypothetical protein ACFVG1_31295 [Streptomyces bacillaris]|uniref:hypothetical protein n=1 Tax=Streptomyces bacillaris TaxID=68179 RepID=UPI0035DD78AE
MPSSVVAVALLRGCCGEYRGIAQGWNTASSPVDQAVVDEFREMLTALRNSEPWTPGAGSARDIYWQPGYTQLTHVANGLHLPDDINMAPAHYALYIEARKRDDSLDGCTLLRLGPYNETRHAQKDGDRLTPHWADGRSPSRPASASP